MFEFNHNRGKLGNVFVCCIFFFYLFFFVLIEYKFAHKIRRQRKQTAEMVTNFQFMYTNSHIYTYKNI